MAVLRYLPSIFLSVHPVETVLERDHEIASQLLGIVFVEAFRRSGTPQAFPLVQDVCP